MAIPRSAWRQFELSMLYAMVIATTGGVGFMIWGIKTGQIEKIDLDGISHKRADGRVWFSAARRCRPLSRRRPQRVHGHSRRSLSSLAVAK